MPDTPRDAPQEESAETKGAVQVRRLADQTLTVTIGVPKAHTHEPPSHA
jgi:hypothetical protein